jgi:hypothetical protein
MAGELIAANAQWLDGYAWRLPSTSAAASIAPRAVAAG